MVAVAETRSFARGEIVMNEVAGCPVSASSLRRLTGDVGGELAERREQRVDSDEALAKRPADPPRLAVVECDGGRIRTREPGHGPGVHNNGQGWRETKVACLQSATLNTHDHDPQPAPPECFCDPEHVAKIAETEALSVAAPESVPEPDDPRPDADEPDSPRQPPRIRRIVRTVLCSLARSDVFGQQMQREAKRRRFFEAAACAFLGDGLPWNWSIWKKRFPDFEPILDFIHVLSYLFVTAKAVQEPADAAWSQYLTWMRDCWQGRVDQVLQDISDWQTRLGDPPEDCPETDPRRVVATTLGYLTNNRARMQYPKYRHAGLPVTTAWMESLVKQVGYRVKGSEMFWNDPEGAEAILQVRAAALSEDDRLQSHLTTRPGYPFVRRPKPRSLSI